MKTNKFFLELKELVDKTEKIIETNRINYVDKFNNYATKVHDN